MSGPRRGLACLAGLALIFASPVQAATQNAQGGAATFAFDVPAEPLDEALANVARTTGMQLLSDSNLIAGRRGNALGGRMTAEEALTRLLAGTGLRARFTARGAIVITSAVTADLMLEPLHVQAAPVLGGGPDERAMAYVALVQRDLVAAAQAEPRLAAGAYRISLRLWLDPTGRIVRSEVIEGSGDAARDSAFCATMRNVRISEAPPQSLPEPLRIEFQVR